MPTGYAAYLYNNQPASNGFSFGYVALTRSFMIPHPDKKLKGGEDACFVSKWYPILNNSVLAVADGVGGWNDHGIDPAKYSRKLCSK